MYIKDPMEIEKKSMQIIEEKVGKVHSYRSDEFTVVSRTIHTTGDFDYVNIVRFKDDAINCGLEALRSGCRIVTDTNMGYSGINKNALASLNCSISCFVADLDIAKAAKDKGVTRSIAALEKAVSQSFDIFVIGNAPTALFRLGELIYEGKISPKLIIGVPVGFVGAAESKEYIRGFDVPSITTEGNKGGSNVAAAIVNALLYMIYKRA